MEYAGNKSRWTHCACQGSHLLQTHKDWCALGIFYSGVSWAGWLFICIYTFATFLISGSTFFCRTVRKMASSVTGRWEKCLFLFFLMLFLKSVKLISNFGAGWWVLGFFWQVLRRCLLFIYLQNTSGSLLSLCGLVHTWD